MFKSEPLLLQFSYTLFKSEPLLQLSYTMFKSEPLLVQLSYTTISKCNLLTIEHLVNYQESHGSAFTSDSPYEFLQI